MRTGSMLTLKTAWGGAFTQILTKRSLKKSARLRCHQVPGSSSSIVRLAYLDGCEWAIVPADYIYMMCAHQHDLHRLLVTLNVANVSYSPDVRDYSHAASFTCGYTAISHGLVMPISPALQFIQPGYLLHVRISYCNGIHPVKVRAAASGNAGYMSAVNAP